MSSKKKRRITRQTENEALRAIRMGDIEAVAISECLEFGHIEWRFVLLVKHINFGLGQFANDITLQMRNPHIIQIVATRLDAPYYYVDLIMYLIAEKMFQRVQAGLPDYPPCTPHEEIDKHRELLTILSQVQHANCLTSSASLL